MSNEKSLNKVTKNFTKADLKTGMILEFNTGELAMVLRGTKDGDIVSGPHSCYPLDETPELGSKEAGQYNYIVKVYQPKTNIRYLYPGIIFDLPVIWRLGLNSEKRRELESQIAKLQAELKGLG